MRRLLSLLLLWGVLSPATWAAPPQKPLHTKAARKHTHVQPPFSFLPPHQPSETMQRLQSTLTGRVVETRPFASLSPFAPAIKPQYTQIFLNPEQLQALTQQASPKITQVQQPKMNAQPRALHKPRIDYPLRSWVTDLNADQAKVLATSISAYLASQNHPETTTLLLAVPHKKQRQNPLSSALSDELRKTGFALVETRSQAENTQIIQYQINRLDDGIWVKLRLPHTEVNRYYHLNTNNQLVATTPFSVRPINPEGKLK